MDISTIVSATLIGISVMKNVVVFSMTSVVVANISINKVFLQFNLKGRKR